MADQRYSPIFAEAPPAAPQSFWTPERDARLRELWAGELSATLIAKEMGAISKNAVLGRVHRLHLPQRRPPVIRDVRPKKIVRLDEHVDHRKLLDPRVNSAGKCRYILGDTAGPNTRFCAETVIGGAALGKQAYCTEHYAIVYVPTARQAAADRQQQAA